MSRLDDLVGKAKRLAEEHPDTVRTGLDKVGDLVDKGTGGRFREQVRQGRDLAKDALAPQDRTTVEGHPSPADDAPAGPQTSPSAEVRDLDEEQRPTTGETVDTEVVGPDDSSRGRTPGQVG